MIVLLCLLSLATAQDATIPRPEPAGALNRCASILPAELGGDRSVDLVPGLCTVAWQPTRPECWSIAEVSDVLGLPLTPLPNQEGTSSKKYVAAAPNAAVVAFLSRTGCVSVLQVELSF